MNSTLDFNEFSDASLEQWKKLLTKELGEKPFESLIWTDSSGNTMQPYYTEAPQSFGASSFPTSWLIHQSPSHASNETILDCLMGGANSISLPHGATAADIQGLLKGVYLDAVHITFQAQDNAAEQFQALLDLAKSEGVNASSLNATFSLSPEQASFKQELAALVAAQKSAGTNFKLALIAARHMHEQGGNAALEIRYALNAGHEALLALMELGLDPKQAAEAIEFNFAASNSFFSEIAKLRAFRSLWNTLAGAYANTDTVPCHVFSTTSLYLQSTLDSYTNLLRATTQAMSAVLGGAEKLEVRPFNQAAKAESSASLRWARNIQHLLMEESYFTGLGDVAKGAYYIEELSAQFVAQSWTQFQADEKAGGFTLILQELKAEAARMHTQNIADVASGKRVVLGVNKYPNKVEQVSGAGMSGRLTTQAEEQTLAKTQA
jgi:methylmalonyl-CoA mutase